MTELIFLFLPIVISLLLSVNLLFFSKKNKSSLKYLGIYFLLLTLVLTSVILQYQKEFYVGINNYIVLISILFYVSIISLPPSVYFYILAITGMKSVSPDLLIKHYAIPFILLLINISAMLYLGFDSSANSTSVDLCKKVWNGANFFTLIFLFPILSVFYLLKSFKIYVDYKKKIKEVFSFNEGINLKWMLIFLIGYLLYVISFITLPPNSSPLFVYVPMIMYLLFVGIMGMKQNDVLFEKDIEDINGVKGEERKYFKENVIEFMKEEEPFLNDELTIYQLSKMLNTNTKYLSSLLNKDFNMNFTSFINSYRIEKSKELLSNNETKKYTIEVIGEMSGFKSKSAFNKWFKYFTNKTPSQYKKGNN